LIEPRCRACGEKPLLKSTKHLYIDLPKIKDRLEAWIKTASEKGNWANNAVQMTSAWIRDGLRERAITRDLKWGIPVPKAGFENKVFYVWFDAPIGYISITGNLGEDRGGGWKQFVDYWWKSPDDTELFQFIGKDNIPFHTVIFPSSLLGSGGGANASGNCEWTMLHHMSSTEYLNYESGKFSKSKGIGVFGTDVMETGIPADVWRFYIFYNRPERADALFTWKDFAEKVNGELIGNLGNLVNRTLSFVGRYYNGKIPASGNADSPFLEAVRTYEKDIAGKLERAELRDAFRAVFELSSLANKAFQDAEPWRLRTDDPPRAAAVIRELSLVVRDLAVLVEPYMPATAAKIASFFGLTLGKDLGWEDLGGFGKLDGNITSEVLFAKLEDDAVNAFREKYSGSQSEREEQKDAAPPAEKTAAAAEIAGAFGSTLDLRVAKIVKIERHPGADKLYIETLDIAGEERIIVSGLVPFYKEDELLGKHIIVAYNLKPAKLRGVESRGMLLAAADNGGAGPDGGPAERCEVLDAGETPTGVRVRLEGQADGPEPPAEIDIDTFFSIPIAVKDHVVEAGGKAFTLLDKPVRTKIIPSGGVH
jgi:methionyl-tRNA synthetase